MRNDKGKIVQHGDLSNYDDTFLQKICATRCLETGCASPGVYNALLERDPAEVTAFKAALSISYSEFFRNPLTFAVLEQLVIPQLIQKKHHAHHGELRIWSAGCAGGQEPYSLAIICEELLENSGEKVEYRIFATDADETQICQARTGRFFEKSLDNVGLKRVNRWFTRQHGEYTVRPHLADRIEFSVYDMLDATTNAPPSSIFGGFDLVICCNLLLYYKPEVRTLIIDKLANSLGDDGYIVAGETERGCLLAYGCTEVFPRAAIFKSNHPRIME